MRVLREMFPQNVISRSGDVPLPARLPDLSACDYCLRGYLNSRVLVCKPRTIDELRQRIKEETAAIRGQMTRRVMENLRERLEQYLRNHGRHLNDEIFKT
jgi:hypothetical protein